MAQGHNPSTVMLTMAHFKQVRDAIWDARVKYQNIGIELGLSPDDVDAIVEDEGGKVEKCFVEVLKRCLKDGISQKKIADALQSTPVGYGYLGREFLDKKFAPHKEQHHDFKADIEHPPAAAMTAQSGSTSAEPPEDSRLAEIIASVPPNNRWKLEQEIDFEHKINTGTIPRHLGKIADSMESWEGAVADCLNLTAGDKSAIRGKDQELQRRKALEKWKSRHGKKATYKALIKVFLDADKLDYAYIVSDLFKDPGVSGPSVAPTVSSPVVSPAAIPHARAAQPGGHIGLESGGKSDSAKKPRISSDYAGIQEGTNQHHKQEKKMATTSTTVPVQDINSPEYLAIQSKFGDLIDILDDPANKSRASKKLFEAKMITTMPSENISGESMVGSVLQGIKVNAMKFYKFLAVLQTLSTPKDTLERIHEAFLYEIKQKIPPGTYKDRSVAPHPAFLSFSRQRPYHDSVDSRTYTGKFYDHLQDKGGNPWMDANDIESGDYLSVTIYRTLDECKAVVPIVTRGYARSLWCMRELYYAMSRGSIQIHPVVIEDGWENEEAGKWLKSILKDKKMNIVKDPTDEQKMKEVSLKIAKALSNTKHDQPEPCAPNHDEQNEGKNGMFSPLTKVGVVVLIVAVLLGVVMMFISTSKN